MKTMKYILAIAMALSLMIMMGCNNDGKKQTSNNGEANGQQAQQPQNTTQLLTTLQMKVEEPQTFENLTITIMSIEDSRCIKGANCMWKGTAMSFFKVSDGKRTYDLFACDWDARQHVPDCNNETSAFGYKFKIASVSPYPTMEHLPAMDEFVVEMKIGK